MPRSIRIVIALWALGLASAAGWATLQSGAHSRHRVQASWMPPMVVVAPVLPRHRVTSIHATGRQTPTPNEVSPATPAVINGTIPVTNPNAAIWRTAGQRYGIDPLLLYAVALVETGHTIGQGQVAPTPWVVRVNGNVISGSRRHVQHAIRLAQALGAQIEDVGMMQVYYPVHHTWVTSPEKLLDPSVNVMDGARILAKALRSSHDTILGIGHYHSDERGQAYSYGIAVWRVWQRLQAGQRLVALAGPLHRNFRLLGGNGNDPRQHVE